MAKLQDHQDQEAEQAQAQLEGVSATAKREQRVMEEEGRTVMGMRRHNEGTRTRLPSRWMSMGDRVV